MNALIVFLGAGIGGALRHGVNVLCLRLLGSGFAYGTLAVNIVGSCAMGLLTAFFALKMGNAAAVRLFLTTGVLGGFTTFSTFSLDSVVLFERGAYGLAALYIVMSLAASMVGLVAALAIGRTLWGV
ncbi:fluoride efflux transporter CrcB [Faunimonas pinastri]|nr:fluoride efflux transporter CrcB [Faunimonas pinastri]